MARKKINKNGLTFLGLGLSKAEESKFKKRLDLEDTDGKKVLRKLVREHYING